MYHVLDPIQHPHVHDRNYATTQLAEVEHLVRRSGSLAGLELVKVVAADGHVATVLVHAALEVVDISLADLGLVVVLGAGVVAGVGVGRSSLLRLGGLLARTAAEETADSVADRGTDGDTTGTLSAFVRSFPRSGLCVVQTYAAVLAIWPKRPGP